ncbi:MAG: outer membrane beta-barrel protein [Bacteroidales bacterium]
MKKIAFILFLFCNISMHAQNLKGIICLEKDKSPAQFASVGLVQLPDSAIVSGGITLSDGEYVFENVKAGKYAIKTSFMGYNAENKNIEVAEGTGTLVLDTIFLAETSTTLNEATVLGERLKGKELVDRTQYSIPAAIAKTSSNGYEILKKVPQVNVDFQNNVTLNGSSNFIIQVDGRQRDKEFLAKLQPTDIETIEIISNPSGKYEGNIDGVINIILKKEARYGMNGNVGLNVKPFNKPTSSLTGSLDYAMGKITFYATGYIFKQNLNINTVAETYFKTIDSTTTATGDGDFKITASSLNAGFDYYMNEKNNLSFNISYKPVSQDIEMISNTLLYENENPVNNLVSLTNNNTKSSETTYSLFYKKTFNKAIQEFTTDIIYYHFNSDEGNDFVNTLYPYEEDTELNTMTRLEDNLNKRDYFSAKLNYVYPVGLTAKIEAGYQFYSQVLSYNFITNNLEDNHLFKYNELRNSVYAGFTANLKKIGFQAMLRVENTNIDADSVSDPNYTCWLPSVNLQYKISASHNVKLTYNRRINRPGIYDMNPYWKISQNYEITQGNPDLKPDYRDRLQLTYTWNFGTNYFSPNVYYEVLSDKVAQRFLAVKMPENDLTTTFAKPFNLLDGYEYGGGINTMLWFVNINARIFKGYFNAYSDQYVTLPAKDYYSFSITSYAFAPLDKKKTATAYVFLSYNGVNVNAQTKTYSIPFYGLGGQKQWKNHTFGAFYLLPFSKNIEFQRTETETTDYIVKNVVGFDVSYYIQFSYSYKFNKGKNVKKLDRKIDVESDSKNQGIGK